MSERAALKGGRLRAGRSVDGFAVRLWLPAGRPPDDVGLPADGIGYLSVTAKPAS
jgi:hypothetical protein